MEVRQMTLGGSKYVYSGDIVLAVVSEARGSEYATDTKELSNAAWDVIEWHKNHGHKYTSEASARRAVIREMGGFWALIIPWLLSAVARFVIDKLVPWLYSSDPVAQQYNKQLKDNGRTR